MKSCTHPPNSQTTEEQMLKDLMQLISSSHETWSHHSDPPDTFTISIKTINLNLHDNTTKTLKQVLTCRGTVPLPKFFTGMPHNTLMEKAAEYFYVTSLNFLEIDRNLDQNTQRLLNRTLNHPYNYEQVSKLFEQTHKSDIVTASVKLFQYWAQGLSNLSAIVNSGSKLKKTSQNVPK